MTRINRIGLCLLSIALLLFLPLRAMAASSSTTQQARFGDMNIFEMCWTAHTDGTFTTTATAMINGLVLGVTTDPESPAPTDDYDITLTDQYGIDIMGGYLANRDTANSEFATPQSAYFSHGMPVHGTLNVDISGNSQNGAKGRIIIYYKAD